MPRQIIIPLTKRGRIATRALVLVDGKSYYEIIINGIMLEVTRYVFELSKRVASEIAVEGAREETTKGDEAFKGATSKKEGLRIERRAPSYERV